MSCTIESIVSCEWDASAIPSGRPSTSTDTFTNLPPQGRSLEPHASGTSTPCHHEMALTRAEPATTRVATTGNTVVIKDGPRI